MNYTERDTYGMYKGEDHSGNGEENGAGNGAWRGPKLMGAHTLVGNDVYNQSDENLGEIKEIMLDMRTGEVAYAVLSFGGFFGMGEKLFAVPWSALTLDIEHKRFVLNVNKERLECAPGFEQDQWPDMADPAWQKDIHAYYGSEPAREVRPF